MEKPHRKLLRLHTNMQAIVGLKPDHFKPGLQQVKFQIDYRLGRTTSTGFLPAIFLL